MGAKLRAAPREPSRAAVPSRREARRRVSMRETQRRLLQGDAIILHGRRRPAALARPAPGGDGARARRAVGRGQGVVRPEEPREGLERGGRGRAPSIARADPRGAGAQAEGGAR